MENTLQVQSCIQINIKTNNKKSFHQRPTFSKSFQCGPSIQAIDRQELHTSANHAAHLTHLAGLALPSQSLRWSRTSNCEVDVRTLHPHPSVWSFEDSLCLTTVCSKYWVLYGTITARKCSEADAATVSIMSIWHLQSSAHTRPASHLY